MFSQDLLRQEEEFRINRARFRALFCKTWKEYCRELDRQLEAGMFFCWG